MSSSPPFETLLAQITVIANKYPMGQMLKGFTPDLINLLMQNHLEKIKLASTYESAAQLINDSLASKLGAGMDVSQFITADADRVQLYSLFAEWRTKLLSAPAV